VALDPLQRPLRQHDALARHVRQRAHADRRRPERVLAAERQHLAAVDVALAHQLPQPRDPRLGDRAPRRDRLQADARDPLVVARREQRHDRRPVALEQQQPGFQAADRAVADLDRRELGRARLERHAVLRAAPRQLGQADAKAVVERQPDQLRLGLERVERDLHVDVVVLAQVLAQDLELGRVGAEVLAHAAADLGLGRRRVLLRPAPQPDQRAGQFVGVHHSVPKMRSPASPRPGRM
jgi:hypothetical protein